MFKLLSKLHSSWSSSVLGKPPGCISRIWFGPLPTDSKWIKPGRVTYIENNEKKTSDIVKIVDGVVVVLFNKTREKLIFVRQFRGSVYHGICTGRNLVLSQGEVDLEQFPPEMGVTLELCGGAVDKNKSLLEIAQEEVLEECGYEVATESLQYIFDYRSGVGASSGAMTLFYCEVSDDQQLAAGGGVDSEVIQVVELSLEEAKKLVQTGAKTNGGPSCIMGLLWFFLNRASI